MRLFKVAPCKNSMHFFRQFQKFISTILTFTLVLEYQHCKIRQPWPLLFIVIWLIKCIDFWQGVTLSSCTYTSLVNCWIQRLKFISVQTCHFRTAYICVCVCLCYGDNNKYKIYGSRLHYLHFAIFSRRHSVKVCLISHMDHKITFLLRLG